MSQTAYALGNHLTFESALALDSTLLGALEQAALLLRGELQRFASDATFGDKMQVAFGTGVNPGGLQAKWQAGDLSGFPPIEVLSAGELNGANGAYSLANSRIYLSEEFLVENRGNLEAIATLLLEEFGHWVDSTINTTDAPGDEGEIFSTLVRGQQLSQTQLQELKLENDQALIVIDGQTVEIERSGSYSGSNLNEVSTGLDTLLSQLQAAVSAQVFGSSLPLLGTQLKNAPNNEVQFLNNLRTTIQSALRQQNTLTSSTIQQALFNALGNGGKNILKDINGNGIDINDIQITETADNLKFSLNLGKAASKFITKLDSK